MEELLKILYSALFTVTTEIIVYANVTIWHLMQWSGCNSYLCCVTNCIQSHFRTQACIARIICANILALGVLDAHYK